MKVRRTPRQKKALEYARDTRFGGEDPQLQRKAWPRKKALRNQTYRRQVQRSIARALRDAERVEDVAPAIPRRRLSLRRGGPVRLGEWVRWKMATRVHRTGWNFFKDEYDPERHRAAFNRFLGSVVESRAARRLALVELIQGLLDGVGPMDQPGEFQRLYRVGRDPVGWFRAFLRDEPEWEGRLRGWVAGPHVEREGRSRRPR